MNTAAEKKTNLDKTKESQERKKSKMYYGILIVTLRRPEKEDQDT